jgi:hypothetical protein
MGARPFRVPRERLPDMHRAWTAGLAPATAHRRTLRRDDQHRPAAPATCVPVLPDMDVVGSPLPGAGMTRRKPQARNSPQGTRNAWHET